MTEIEMKKITKAADFFENKGYTTDIEDPIISYSGDGIDFIIIFEPNSDVSDISIKFSKENEVYSIGWIACVRSGLSVKPHQRLENVLTLLSYIKDNYSMIIDIDYCRESNKLIDEFIANERKRCDI